MAGEISKHIAKNALRGIVHLDQVANSRDTVASATPLSTTDTGLHLIDPTTQGVALLRLFSERGRLENGQVFHATDLVYPDDAHSIQLIGKLPEAEEEDFEFELETSRFLTGEGSRFTHTSVRGKGRKDIRLDADPLTINDKQVEPKLHIASIR